MMETRQSTVMFYCGHWKGEISVMFYFSKERFHTKTSSFLSMKVLKNQIYSLHTLESKSDFISWFQYELFIVLKICISKIYDIFMGFVYIQCQCPMFYQVPSMWSDPAYGENFGLSDCPNLNQGFCNSSLNQTVHSIQIIDILPINNGKASKASSLEWIN